MKIEKISKLSLLISVVLIVVCFGAYFIAGDSDEMIGDKNVPVLIDVVMWLMYGLAIVATALTLWGVYCGIMGNKGNDAATTTGVPGGKVTMCVIGLLVASLAAGYVSGMGAEAFTATDGTETSAAWVQVVDTFCWSIGILTVAAAAAVVVSMSGILTKTASK